MRVRRIAGITFWLAALACPVILMAQGRRPAAIVREADFSEKPYLSLDDVATVMGGELHDLPVSRRVDFTFPSHQVQFFLDSTKAVVDEEPVVLDAPAIKDGRGVWVPKMFFSSGTLAGDFYQKMDLGPGWSPHIVPRVKRPAPEAKPIVSITAPAPILKTSAPVIPAVKPAKTLPVAAESAEAPEPPPIPHTIKRIVVDPGHGGKDPGAISPRGTVEKDINLWMARELADALREKDFEVLLTRTDDTFIPLAERANLANRHKADLFISIHCNASLSSKMSGFETYILSEKASDPHAADVARLENAALQFEGKAPSGPVQSVLRSLIKNSNINRSAQLGAIMNRSVAKESAHPDLGVQQAAFYVLRGAEMPAILLELGFLTNKGEEQMLEDSAYRHRLIQAIESSIVDFDQKQKKL